MTILSKLLTATLPLAMIATSCTTDNTEVDPNGPSQGELWTGSLAPAPYAADAACFKLSNATIDGEKIQSIELSASGFYYVTKDDDYSNNRSETRTSEANSIRIFRPANKPVTRDWLPYESIITGNYTKLSNGKYRLDGFGDMDIASDGKVDITLTSGENYIWRCELMPKMADNALNSRLCRTWKTTGVRYEFLNKKYKVIYSYTCTPDEVRNNYIGGCTFTSAGRMYEYDEGDWYGYTWSWSNEKGQLIQLMADDEDDGSGICQVIFDNNKITFINPFVFEYDDPDYEFSDLECAGQIPSSAKYAREIVTLIECNDLISE